MKRFTFLIPLLAVLALPACTEDITQPEVAQPQFAMTSTDWNFVETDMEMAEIDSEDAEDGLEYIETWLPSLGATIDGQISAFEDEIEAWDTNVKQGEDAAQNESEYYYESELDQIADLNLNQLRFAILNMKGCINGAGCSGSWPQDSLAVEYLEKANVHLYNAQGEFDDAEVDLANEDWTPASADLGTAALELRRAGYDINSAVTALPSSDVRTVLISLREVVWNIEFATGHVKDALGHYASGQSGGCTEFC